MKTVCFVLDQQDAWIAEYWKNKCDVEEITIIAPFFEGRVVADSVNVPYKTYEEEAWKIDKHKLSDMARSQSYRWHQLQEIQENPYLEAVRNFKNYPLLVMHQTYLSLAMYEILQAYDFMRRVFELEKPDKIVMGRRENPFNKNRFFILTGSNGMEREAAKVLSINNNIEFAEIPTSSIVRSIKKSGILHKMIKGLRYPKLIVQKAASALKDLARNATPKHTKPRPQFIWDSELSGPRILIFTWADYYLEQLLKTFDYLIRDGGRIGLVFTGGKLTPEQEDTFIEKGICISYKSDWSIENEQGILRDWQNRGLDAFKSISDSEILKNYFSDSDASYFSGLVDEAIKRELVDNIPITVIELLRTEKIISKFEPDLVVAHFALHPLESCNVLPARLLGIPTLTLSHGIPGYTNSVGDTFSTEYYAVVGDVYKDALIQSVKCCPDVLIPVGDSRLEEVKFRMSTRDAKEKFGFNPDHPLCIFCDNSGWTHTLVWRHSTFKTMEKILDLRNHIPDLQIVYRVHHGADYRRMQKYFDGLDIREVAFQTSLSPVFTEIVEAADVVISHHTSAITEALLSGVQVIYLCALSDVEPNYLNCEAIKVAEEFNLLPQLVRSIIESPMAKEDVMAMAKPYFDRTLCGNDRKATERLAQLMLKLARASKAQRKKGFQDWFDRIDASCEFECQRWNSDKTLKQQSLLE